MSLKAREIAKRIRDKVGDLNDELILAAAAEVRIEFVICKIDDLNDTTELRVYCSQEV